VTAAEELRPLLFGNVPVEAWPSDDDATAEPWASFVRARRHLAAGDADLAIREWAPIATFDLWEPRHRLQAWTFLRSAGIQPDEGIARSVLGVVAEVSVGDGHDALAAYADGSIRFLHHEGGVFAIDSARYDLVMGATALLGVGQQVADQLGPWPGPDLPPLEAGETRFTMLTPGGPVIGQGPDDDLRADPLAGPLYDASTALLAAVVGDTAP
jgi:hypothetical protein